MKERIQTRKDEVRYKTSDIKRMYGKFLAKDLLKTWIEDFLDESTGEVVSIERNEILFQRGKYIDDDLLGQLNFSLQAGEISEVEVSNQRRLATPLKASSLWPFKVTARINAKNYAFILQAQDVVKAFEVATDYIELNYTNGFAITGVKALKSFIILNDIYKPVAEALPAEEKPETEEENDGEEKRDDTKYYKIEANVSMISTEGTEEIPEELSYDFLVRTKDVDTAKVVITAWINNKLKEKEEDGKRANISIASATPFPCNRIIEREFCLAYQDEEE